MTVIAATSPLLTPTDAAPVPTGAGTGDGFAPVLAALLAPSSPAASVIETPPPDPGAAGTPLPVPGKGLPGATFLLPDQLAPAPAANAAPAAPIGTPADGNVPLVIETPPPTAAEPVAVTEPGGAALDQPPASSLRQVQVAASPQIEDEPAPPDAARASSELTEPAPRARVDLPPRPARFAPALGSAPPSPPARAGADTTDEAADGRQGPSDADAATPSNSAPSPVPPSPTPAETAPPAADISVPVPTAATPVAPQVTDRPPATTRAVARAAVARSDQPRPAPATELPPSPPTRANAPAPVAADPAPDPAARRPDTTPLPPADPTGTPVASPAADRTRPRSTLVEPTDTRALASPDSSTTTRAAPTESVAQSPGVAAPVFAPSVAATVSAAPDTSANVPPPAATFIAAASSLPAAPGLPAPSRLKNAPRQSTPRVADAAPTIASPRLPDGAAAADPIPRPLAAPSAASTDASAVARGVSAAAEPAALSTTPAVITAIPFPGLSAPVVTPVAAPTVSTVAVEQSPTQSFSVEQPRQMPDSSVEPIASRPAAPQPTLPTPPPPQPPSESFGAALHRAVVAERRPRRDVDVQAIAPAAAAPLTPTATSAPVDTARADWPATMLTRIEQLRDQLSAPGTAADTRIRLHPDALGSVEVTLRQDATGTHVHLAAAEPAAARLLADAQPQLQSLAEQRGLRLAQTEVGGGTTQTGQGWSGDRRQPAPAPTASPRRPAPANDTQADDSADSRLA